MVRRRLSASLSLPPPSPANCTNMIRACETGLSQIFPFPLTPTYLKPFPCGCWDSPLLCLHPRGSDRSFSRISQLPKPQLLRFHCLRMSWQRRIMTGLENPTLASLYAVVSSDPHPPLSAMMVNSACWVICIQGTLLPLRSGFVTVNGLCSVYSITISHSDFVSVCVSDAQTKKNPIGK